MSSNIDDIEFSSSQGILWGWIQDQAWTQNYYNNHLGLDEARAVTKPREEYKRYKIRLGKSGKLRYIQEPSAALKKVQQILIRPLSKLPLHKACMSRQGKSILDNATPHANAKHVLKIDIKDCYPSIHSTHIDRGYNELSYQNEFPIPLHILTGIKEICLLDDYLPTGAPTSPILCNIALYGLDLAVQKIADEYGYTYTRYMDDIHLSTSAEKRQWGIKKQIEEAIIEYELTPNYRKNKWLTNHKSDNIIITGVRIGTNEKVPREYRRMIRSRLQNLAKDGKDIDAETRGCLAYIKSLDQDRYEALMKYYQRRRDYGSRDHQGVSTGPEQVLPSSSGVHSTKLN